MRGDSETSFLSPPSSPVPFGVAGLVLVHNPYDSFRCRSGGQGVGEGHLIAVPEGVLRLHVLDEV